MQLRIKSKAPKHHHACTNYGIGPARTCAFCEPLRQRDAARRTSGPMPADDLRGER